VLKVEIGPDEPSLVTVIDRRDGAQCGTDLRELVKLECGMGLQQVEIARVREKPYCFVDGAFDGAQSRQIAGERSFLVETINMSRYPFRVGRSRARGTTRLGDVFVDLHPAANRQRRHGSPGVREIQVRQESLSFFSGWAAFLLDRAPVPQPGSRRAMTCIFPVGAGAHPQNVDSGRHLVL
jgi:hypothetical protein